MIVNVDLDTGASVADPDDLGSFHVVAVTGDDVVVGSAMGDAGHAAGEGHVWVSAAWVKQDVASSVDPGWAAKFDSMLAYAASKGWLNDAGTHIMAHIEGREVL